MRALYLPAVFGCCLSVCWATTNTFDRFYHGRFEPADEPPRPSPWNISDTSAGVGFTGRYYPPCDGLKWLAAGICTATLAAGSVLWCRELRRITPDPPPTQEEIDYV
jgi:hypothetical protein